MISAPVRPDEVAVLAPTGRDGPLAERALARWDLHAVAYADMLQLCEAVRRGVGLIIVGEEALRAVPRQQLVEALDDQPSWSDIPLIVLTAEGELSRTIAEGVELLAARGNVTLLERPVRVATLVTAVRTALRARQRQYEIRDYLEELRRARESAENARNAAENANRAKAEFLAVMSHELRTPLNAIGGYAAIMALGIRGPLTAEQRFDLDRIQKSQRHLLGLINGVLNYARIEAGNLRYEVANVPVAELMSVCEALVAPQARSRRLELHFAPCPPSLYVRADQDKVQQIVLNLLTNAIKFTDPGGKISVRCELVDDAVQLTVADTGHGIAPEKLDVIFDPFVQVDSGLTRTHEGVGLGLAISRDLAQGMGGDLAVESTLGQGSIFTLSLPSAEVSDAEVPRTPLPTSAGSDRM